MFICFPNNFSIIYFLLVIFNILLVFSFHVFYDGRGCYNVVCPGFAQVDKTLHYHTSIRKSIRDTSTNLAVFNVNKLCRA